MTLHQMLVRCTIVAVLATACAQARAQDWPAKPVTVVVAAAADGPIDVLARLIAQRMGPSLGQHVVVQNVGGSGGITGGQRVAKAAPDGYTTLLGTIATHANPQLLTGKPPYNPVDDFAPVALIAEIPLVLVVRKTLPTNTFEEFVAYAKKNQASMSFGSAGVGSASHLGCVMLQRAMGTTIPAPALSRHRARHAGPGRRAARFPVRHRGDGGAEHQGRRRQGARQPVGAALARAARSADRRRTRLARRSRPTPGPRCLPRKVRPRRSSPSCRRPRSRR